MLNRVKEIIKREKLQHPHALGITLLFQRVAFVLKLKIRERLIKWRKDGTFSTPDVMSMCSLFPKQVLDLIIAELNPSSVLDVGCGTGKSLQYFLNQNIDAIGIENSELAISLSGISDKIIRHNLNKEIDLKRSFDLVWSFEVIEHIHPDYENNFLKTLNNHSSIIIVSAAKPGQGGHGHFNEQEPSYWIEKFKSLGYLHDDIFSKKMVMTGDNHSENLLCFRKV